MFYRSSSITLLASSIFSSVDAKAWTMTNAPKVTSVGAVVAVSAEESYAAITDNGFGPGVEHTTDGYETEEELFPYGLINTGIAFNVHTHTGLLAFGGGGLATFDSEGVFTHDESFGGFGQDAHSFGTNSFGAAGNFFSTQTIPPVSVDGVAVSRDNGASWELFDSGLGSNYPARYASFPSDDTWYLTGGKWPTYSAPKAGDAWNSTSSEPQEYHLSSKITLRSKDGKTTQVHFQRDKQQTEVQSSGMYYGFIAKTTNGGRTWETVYTSDEFYFNQIDCIDESHCMAAAEGNGRTYALSTTNGGKTWRTVHQADDNSSLMGCVMLSETEAWLSGGNMDLEMQGLAGYFWHTLDAGETWELEKLKDAVSLGMSFAEGVGYSTATNEFQAGVAVYH